MSIGSRLSRMFRAWRFRGNDIDDLKDKLDETYRTQATLLQQVRRSVADVATSRKRVELQLAALNQQMSQLDDQARQAVGQGNDDEARTILARKVSLEKAADELSRAPRRPQGRGGQAPRLGDEDGAGRRETSGRARTPSRPGTPPPARRPT